MNILPVFRIDEALKNCESILLNTRRKLKRDELTKAKKLIKKIKNRKKDIDYDQIWDIYGDLQAIILSLGLLLKDQDWRR